MTSALFFNRLMGKQNPVIFRKIFMKMIITSVIVGILYSLAAMYIRFVVTATPSLPHRFFVLWKRDVSNIFVPTKERYVVFDHSAVQTRVIKHVKGVPGSRIHYDEKGNLWVDAYCVGKPYTTSQSGKPMHAIKSGVIPEGYVFVYAPHERSFDSRYEEFGLIPIHRIQGEGVALL